MLTFKGKGSHRIETPKSRERKSFQVVVVGKNSTLNAGDLRDMGSIPGSGSSPRGGLGKPLQYSCLENSIDRGDWQTTVHGSQRVQT